MLSIQTDTMAMLLSEFDFLQIYRADLAGSRTLSFQAPEPSSSEEEDFKVYFIFEPKTPPRRRAISDPKATIRIILVEVR